MFEPATWEDFYVCAHCADESGDLIALDLIPWGKVRENGEGLGRTIVYPRTRHPGMRADGVFVLPPADGRCRGCCGFARRGLVCGDCREAGWSDAYGTVAPPPERRPLTWKDLYFAPEQPVRHTEDCAYTLLRDAPCTCGAIAHLPDGL
jgi:hypothetical protein